MPEGQFDERRAHVRAAELAAAYVRGEDAAARQARERATVGPTFREVAHAYLDWLQKVKGAAPSTLQQHRSDLAEPDVPYRRGHGLTAGHIMRPFGDVPAAKITIRDVDELLETVAKTGVSARTVNRYRDVVRAVFNFGVRSSKFKLGSNPATDADSRRVAALGDLVYYLPDEIELVAGALEQGMHRQVNENHARSSGSRRAARCDCTPTYGPRGQAFGTVEEARGWYHAVRTVDELAADRQDAEAVRVAAYAGLRMGELLALRVGDVDQAASVITVKRAISAGAEKGPKSGRVRQVPLARQAASALERLLEREDFTSPDDFVFCNAFGRRLSAAPAVQVCTRHRRFASVAVARSKLRHTFGSLLVAGGIDLVSVKDAMGHAQLTTTTRYLHARPASERAAAFTAAFNKMAPADASASNSRAPSAA